MRKHVYAPVVLVCTLSTHCDGNERTLPDQDTKGRLDAILERQPANLKCESATALAPTLRVSSLDQ